MLLPFYLLRHLIHVRVLTVYILLWKSRKQYEKQCSQANSCNVFQHRRGAQRTLAVNASKVVNRWTTNDYTKCYFNGHSWHVLNSWKYNVEILIPYTARLNSVESSLEINERLVEKSTIPSATALLLVRFYSGRSRLGRYWKPITAYIAYVHIHIIHIGKWAHSSNSRQTNK